MKIQRSLLLSCFLALALCQTAIASNHARQVTATPSSQNTPPPTTSTETTTSTTSPTTSETTQTTQVTTTSGTTTSNASPTTSQPTTTSASATQTTPPTNDPATVITSPSITDTGAITVTQTNTASSSSDTAATSSPTAAPPPDNSGLGTGSIIGMSVAGGIAVIALIAFFIWKFSRKRFTDFDDNEAIKWPELNTHGGSNLDSHPLPVHNTGRAGFDTGSEASLSRAPSTSNYSTPDIGGVSHDPYAVPPLPHLNPNQPYRDDPPTHNGFYDPYRGPVPNTLEHGTDWHGEAIPMTQMVGANTGRMSPAQVPYGAGGPQMAYGGRVSPGPQAAYNAGRVSPGPQAAYNAGRMSPGPHAAYGHGL